MENDRCFLLTNFGHSLPCIYYKYKNIIHICQVFHLYCFLLYIPLSAIKICSILQFNSCSIESNIDDQLINAQSSAWNLHKNNASHPTWIEIYFYTTFEQSISLLVLRAFDNIFFSRKLIVASISSWNPANEENILYHPP